MLRKAIESSVIHGVRVARFASIVSRLLFADDSIILTQEDMEEK